MNQIETSTKDLVTSMEEIIHIILQDKKELDMEFFDTLKLIPSSDDYRVKNMLGNLDGCDYKLTYNICDQEAYEYGNYFGDINISVNGNTEYIVEFVLGKNYDFVGVNIYSRDWRIRLN